MWNNKYMYMMPVAHCLLAVGRGMGLSLSLAYVMGMSNQETINRQTTAINRLLCR